ncbi:MAG: ABC transporter permease [Candidatus Andersenbacteria bacterium]|nr:ABC transporter permease [Candidatus Andersenbacteria bacterium]
MSTNFLKTFSLALTGLKSNKTRTSLSVLGIVIGVAAVIVIVSVGQGLRVLIVDQISVFGENMMSVSVKVPGSDYGASMQSMVEGTVITTLKYDDVEAVRDKKRFPYVKAVSGYSAGVEWATYQEKEKQVMFIGSDAYYPDIDGQAKVAQGRYFTNEEERGMAKVVVIGSKVAEKFFGEGDPIGKQIKIKKVNFKVIGVMQDRGMIMTFDYDNLVYLPLKTVQKLITGVDHLVEFAMIMEDDQHFAQAEAEISQLLRQRHDIDDPTKDDFEVMSMDQIVEIVNTVTGVISLLLGLLAAISLIVGGVGIMNIMLVIVAERTREIGLRKSLGAKRKDILNQFVTEAALISVLGGIIGIIFGIIISFLITLVVRAYNFDWPFVVSIEAIVISFTVAAFFGIVFGWYPAKKAAKLNPIEALRYE